MPKPAATVISLPALQANAKQESASAAISPPWQLPWPFNMSARTVIVSVAAPGAIATTSMPRACDARSPDHR